MITRCQNLIPKILPGLPGDCIDINYMIAFLTRSIVGIPLLHPPDFDRDIYEQEEIRTRYLYEHPATPLFFDTLFLTTCSTNAAEKVALPRPLSQKHANFWPWTIWY